MFEKINNFDFYEKGNYFNRGSKQRIMKSV